MVTIRQIRCEGCDLDNYVDVDIIHTDKSSHSIKNGPLETEFLHHCTFCTNPIVDPKEMGCN